jgi:hypothetical protein
MEDTMFKTISAALLAVSVLASPAFAATAKTAQTTRQAPVIKAEPVKTNALNANARMGKHHQKHVSHYRHTKKFAVKRSHHAKAGFRHAAPATTKRG